MGKKVKNPEASFYDRVVKMAARIRKEIIPEVARVNGRGKAMAKIFSGGKVSFSLRNIDEYLLNQEMADLYYWIKSEYNDFFNKRYKYMNEYERDQAVWFLEDLQSKAKALKRPTLK